MGTKKPDAFKRYVLDFTTYLRKLIADEYEVFVEFDKALRGEARADTVIDLTYYTITIRVSKALRSQWQQGNYVIVAAALVHEFCHTLTEPLWDLANQDARPSDKERIKKTTEQQTERISRIVLMQIPEWIWNPRVRKEGDNDTTGVLSTVRGGNEGVVGIDEAKKFQLRECGKRLCEFRAD